MTLRNHLSFKNSKIYPDNSHIRWEIDGKGFVGNKQVFQIHSHRDSCFITVLEPGTSFGIETSPIFWDVFEMDRGVNIPLHEYHKNDRRAAMQWAEDYLMNIVSKQLELV